MNEWRHEIGTQEAMLMHQVGEKNCNYRRRARPLCALASIDEPSLSYHPYSVLRGARFYQPFNRLLQLG